MAESVFLQDQASPQATPELEQGTPGEADVEADKPLKVKADLEAALILHTWIACGIQLD